MDNPIDESKFTAEQQLALAAVRAEAAGYAVEIAKSQERTQQLNAEHAALLKGQAMRDGIEASKVTFHDVGLASMLAEKDYDLRFTEDGATGLLDGKRVPLAKIYQHIALVAHPTIADQRSTKALRAEESTAVKPIMSQMTPAEKVAYLHTHSAEEYGMLQRTATITKNIETMADFSSLPVATRTKLLAEHGLAWLEKLAAKRKF